MSKPDPGKWLDLYGDLLYKYTLPRVYDSVTAEDLVQETFLAALIGLKGYKQEASEKNWLFAILKNKIIDHYRKKAKKQSELTISFIETEENWFNEDGHWANNKLYKGWHLSETDTERKELQQIIEKCKDNLKEILQNVFTLKYMEDLKSDEICKVLNISPSNYWVLLHRARIKIRDCIDIHWSNT